MKTKTSLFIHGMFMNPLCWENGIPRYHANDAPSSRMYYLDEKPA